MKIFLTWLFTLATIFVLDMAWLGAFAKGFYRTQMGSLMAERVNWAPAVMFYAMFAAGLVYFVVWPAVSGVQSGRLALDAALLGLLAYATYDLTGWAVIKGWSARLALVDMAWGVALSVVSTQVAYRLITVFLK